MAEKISTPPCVFVSYCWTSPEHIQRIVNFSERLLADGVEVILDQWTLREGHDKYAYMEKMVTDNKVNKVLIFSDKRYQEKADQRKGGVGTESQIISQETYDKVEQDKFIPIVLELDENNKPALPIFLKNRLFIDFSTAENINKNWDRLLRVIYNKPAMIKPTLGKPPSYIFQQQTQYSSNRGSLETFKRAIYDDKNNYLLLARAYLDDFLTTLDNYRLENQNSPSPADILLSIIKDMIFCRDELIEFYDLAFSYKNDAELLDIIISFLEKCLLFNYRSNDPSNPSNTNQENYKFFNHEQFIYLVAILIKYKRFLFVNDLLSHKFYIPIHPAGPSNPLLTYSIFYSTSDILDRENNNKNPRRLSPTADLFKERATILKINFNQFMQSDFILFLRCLFHNSSYRRWFPVSLVYAGWSQSFELFSRATDDKDFESIKYLLNVSSREDFKNKFDSAMREGRSDFSMLTFHADISFENLINYTNIFKDCGVE